MRFMHLLLTILLITFSRCVSATSPCTCSPQTCSFSNLSQVVGSEDYTSLSCIDQQLSGTIPSALGLLSNLVSLDLSRNSLSGPLPEQLGLLSGLSILNLEENLLSGPLPSSYFLSSSLTQLRVGSNQLSGSIENVTLLPNLLELKVIPNEFTGLVPDYVACTSLEEFCSAEFQSRTVFIGIGLGICAFFFLFIAGLIVNNPDAKFKYKGRLGRAIEISAAAGFLTMFPAAAFGLISIIIIVNDNQCVDRYNTIYTCLETDLPAPGTILALTLSPTQSPTITQAPIVSPTTSPTILSFEEGNPEVFAFLITGVPLICIVLFSLLLGKRRELAIVVGFALFDFAGDIAYLSTQTFNSPILFILAVSFLVWPAVAFGISLARFLAWDFLTSFFNKVKHVYQRVYEWDGNATYEEHDKLFKILHVLAVYLVKLIIFVVATFFGVPFILVLSLLMFCLGLVLVVNLKLLVIPYFSKQLNALRGKPETSVVWFNGSIIFEVFFESVPELIIVLFNTYSGAGEPDAVFVAAITGSVIDIVNAGLPFVYHAVKHRSFSVAIRKDLFGHEQSLGKETETTSKDAVLALEARVMPLDSS